MFRKTKMLIRIQMLRQTQMLGKHSCLGRHYQTNPKGKKIMCISRVPNQNGVSLLYIMLEIHHSGWEPSIWCDGLHALVTLDLCKWKSCSLKNSSHIDQVSRAETSLTCSTGPLSCLGL